MALKVKDMTPEQKSDVLGRFDISTQEMQRNIVLQMSYLVCHYQEQAKLLLGALKGIGGGIDGDTASRPIVTAFIAQQIARNAIAHYELNEKQK